MQESDMRLTEDVDRQHRARRNEVRAETETTAMKESAGPRAYVSDSITSMAAALALVTSCKGQYCGKTSECCSLAKDLSRVPQHTIYWERGEQVRGNLDIAVGTAIATFNFYDERTHKGYGPSSSPWGRPGESHCGIYLGQSDKGILILHQWNSSEGPRISTIPWDSWNKHPLEGGNRFYVIRGDEAATEREKHK